MHKNVHSFCLFAEKLYVTRQCVSKWENGTTQPDLQTLTQLSELLGVTVDELIYGNDTDVKKSSKLNNGFFISPVCLADGSVPGSFVGLVIN